MTQDILDTIEFDDDGFMVNAADWTKEVGEAIAAAFRILKI